MSRAQKPAPKHRMKADPAAKVVGARVRKLRKERDWTFDAFVEECGLGRGYVNELERGMVVPSLHTLQKLAAALELTVADLVLGDSLREKVFEATRDIADPDLRKLLQVAEALPKVAEE